MNQDEHRQHHLVWHAALELLLDDFLAHHPRSKLLSNTTLYELFRWSHAQCVRPVERPIEAKP